MIMLLHKINAYTDEVKPSHKVRVRYRNTAADQAMLAKILISFKTILKYKKAEDIAILGIGSGSGFLEQLLHDLDRYPEITASIEQKLQLDCRALLIELAKTRIIASDIREDDYFCNIPKGSSVEKVTLNVLAADAVDQVRKKVGHVDIVVAKHVLHHLYSFGVQHKDIRVGHAEGIAQIKKSIEVAFSAGATFFIGHDFSISEGNPLEIVDVEVRTEQGAAVLQQYIAEKITAEEKTYSRIIDFPMKFKSNTTISLPRIIRDDFYNYAHLAMSGGRYDEKEEVHIYSSVNNFQEFCNEHYWRLCIASHADQEVLLSQHFTTPQRQQLVFSLTDSHTEHQILNKLFYVFTTFRAIVEEKISFDDIDNYFQHHLDTSNKKQIEAWHMIWRLLCKADHPLTNRLPLLFIKYNIVGEYCVSNNELDLETMITNYQSIKSIDLAMEILNLINDYRDLFAFLEAIDLTDLKKIIPPWVSSNEKLHRAKISTSLEFNNLEGFPQEKLSFLENYTDNEYLIKKSRNSAQPVPNTI